CFSRVFDLERQLPYRIDRLEKARRVADRPFTLRSAQHLWWLAEPLKQQIGSLVSARAERTQLDLPKASALDVKFGAEGQIYSGRLVLLGALLAILNGPHPRGLCSHVSCGRVERLRRL